MPSVERYMTETARLEEIASVMRNNMPLDCNWIDNCFLVEQDDIFELLAYGLITDEEL